MFISLESDAGEGRDNRKIYLLYYLLFANVRLFHYSSVAHERHEMVMEAG